MSRAVGWGTQILGLVEYFYRVIYNSAGKFPNYVSLINKADKILAECQDVMIDYNEKLKKVQ